MALARSGSAAKPEQLRHRYADNPGGLPPAEAVAIGETEGELIAAAKAGEERERAVKAAAWTVYMEPYPDVCVLQSGCDCTAHSRRAAWLDRYGVTYRCLGGM